MTDERRREICKAFAYGVSIEDISEVSGMTKDELIQFVEDNKETIAEIQSHYKRME
jgi:hypothetical protein